MESISVNHEGGTQNLELAESFPWLLKCVPPNKGFAGAGPTSATLFD